MNFSPHVAEELRAEMARQKYGIVQMATDTRIPRSRLSRRLSGKTPLDTDELVLVANQLGIPAADIVARAEARVNAA